jgi:hypothetical protein
LEADGGHGEQHRPTPAAAAGAAGAGGARRGHGGIEREERPTVRLDFAS